MSERSERIDITAHFSAAERRRAHWCNRLGDRLALSTVRMGHQ